MTAKIKTTFTNRFNPEVKIEIISRVTDQMEPRNYFKKSYGSYLNRRKFEQDHTRTTVHQGKEILLWDEKVEYVRDTIYIVNYINSKGREIQRTFNTPEDATSFTAVLDARIAKGTCGGYDLTSMDR